jgi:hypothetical protein
VWEVTRNAGKTAMLNRPIFAFSIAFLAAAIAGAAPARTGNRAPYGPGHTWTSPDEKSSVVWERTTPGSDPAEQFFLVLERRCKEPYGLAKFSRSVTVAWSPDSSHIAVSYAGPGPVQSFMATVDAHGAVRRDDVRPTSREWSAISDAPTLWGGWIDDSHISLLVIREANSKPRPGCASYFEYDTKTKDLRYVGPSCDGGFKLAGIAAVPVISPKSKMKTEDRCR